MKVIVRGQGPVTLQPSDFVAEGGQARVYAKGDVAYKVFTDPSAMIPVGKLQELQRIAHPDVMLPDALLQDEKSGRAIGYTMRYLAGVRALGELTAPVCRQRHGLDEGAMLGLIDRLRELFLAVHAADALIVDANDMNFLVCRQFRHVYAIDTDSYQTRSYPASAITPAIRCPTTRVHGPDDAPTFSRGSDWFAFAVLAFQLFVGVHPYRGTHPTIRSLSSRMASHLSAFDPNVTLPPVALPLSGLPVALHDYLRAVLQDGERGPPPAFTHVERASSRACISPPLHVISGTAHGVTLETLVTLPSPIVRVFGTHAGDAVADTTSGLFTLTGRRIGEAGKARRWVAFTPRLARPVLATEDAGRFTLRDVGGGFDIEPPGRIEALGLGGGRLVAQIGDTLVELGLREVGPTVIVTPTVLAQVLPRATRVFDGVAVQSLLGATYLALFGGKAGCRQVHVAELDGHRVLDARSEANVVVLIVAEGGLRHRVVVRVSEVDGSHDVRWTRDIDPGELELVVLDSGVALCRTGAAPIDVFAAAPGSLTLRHIADPRLGVLQLAQTAGSVLAFHGDVVYRLSSRA